MRKEGKNPQGFGNWKRAGTGILIRKGGKNYMVNPKNPVRSMRLSVGFRILSVNIMRLSL